MSLSSKSTVGTLNCGLSQPSWYHRPSKCWVVNVAVASTTVSSGPVGGFNMSALEGSTVKSADALSWWAATSPPPTMQETVTVFTPGVAVSGTLKLKAVDGDDASGSKAVKGTGEPSK